MLAKIQHEIWIDREFEEWRLAEEEDKVRAARQAQEKGQDPMDLS
jgi:hypothetical protein